MSLHGYHYSVKLANLDAPFESLIMAAMRKADSDNIVRLRASFLEIWTELRARYDAAFGVIPEDCVTDMIAVRKNIESFRRQKL